MRIVILNQYYAPDTAATAQLAADLGAELARAGHEVFAIAGDRPYAGEADPLPRRARIDGVEVHRVRATARGRGTRLDRVIDYASFYVGAAVELAMLPKPDVIVALTTPPFIGALAAIDRAARGGRLVLWIMDVYPEVAIALGAVSSSVLGRLLTTLSSSLLARADAIVALDDEMRARLGSHRVTVIDNWWDGRAVRPLAAQHSALRRELDCGDRLVVGYFGNLGLGHDVDTLLAASRCSDHAWLVVGDGPQRAIVERGLDGAWHRLLPPRPRAELGDALAAADCLCVTLDERLAGLVAPSKLYAALAAGRPIVYVGPAAGRTAELVAAYDLGVSVRNGDAEGLVAGLERLRDPDLRATMGKRARDLFDARYDRSLGVAAHRALIESLC